MAIVDAIPSDYLKTVVFLCVHEPVPGDTRHTPKATGFFVRVPIENTAEAIDYVVTARHCLEDARLCDTRLYVRVNLRDGTSVEFPTSIDDWYTHDTADVAAIPLLRSALPAHLQPQDLDSASLALQACAGGPPNYALTLESHGSKREIYPGLGHQVFILGLFSEHYGDKRNLPIARFGNISRMPDSLVAKHHCTTRRIIAYLVDLWSWGGHSGSPVFCLYPMLVVSRAGGPDAPLQDVALQWVSGLIGLVSGHYPIFEDVQTTGDIDGSIQVSQNSGVAIVTPSVAITELLMRDDLVESRASL